MGKFMIKKILKVYGLPRSGTNVVQTLLSYNFKNYVAQIADHNVHYLGWKHGWLLSDSTYNFVEKITKEQILFIFTYRDYNSWQEAIIKRHTGTWEFPWHYWNRQGDKFVFNTPLGPEVYESMQDFYNKRHQDYQDFCNRHPRTTITINYKDLKNNQTRIVEQIQKKFNLELCVDQILTIKKTINSLGQPTEMPY